MEEQIKINKKVVTKVEKLASKTLKLMGSEAKIVVSHDKKNDAVLVNIKSDEERGLLIGKRGETISAIQYLLSIMVTQELGGWIRVLVNIADWRERQEDTLKDLAIQTAERALETNSSQNLYNLTPAQRRIIHLELSTNSKIETTSEGEGQDRYLKVSPKE